MRFIIYGAGNRGKRLTNYIGEDKIVAYIDQDEEKRKNGYCNKKVINLLEYKKKYNDTFIIVTCFYDNTIGSFLEDNEIYQYSYLTDMPSEFIGYGDFSYKKVFENAFDNKQTVYFKEINALTLLALDYCNTYGKKVVFVLDRLDAKREWLRKYYPEAKIINLNEVEDINNFSDKDISDFSKFAGRYYFNKKLYKLKNKYEFQKCFIVATGPSLLIHDLLALDKQKIFTFGVNGILKLKEQWEPNAFVAIDADFLEKNKKNISENNSAYKFISDVNTFSADELLCEYYKLHCITNPLDEMPDIPEDIENKINAGVTVTFVALQIAIYMGFKEIYLLGVDCNYLKGSNQNYFFKDKVIDNKDHNVYSMILDYQAVQKYAEKNNIKIFNATRGGALEVFPRVDFDSLFE